MKASGVRGFVLAALAVTALAFLIPSCSLFGGNGDVYISADGTFGSTDVVCSLYFVSYVDPGDNAYAGRNIYAESVRTVQYGGRSWRVYSIPKGEWDVYFEYHADLDTANARNRVNLELNEWAAIWVTDADHLDTTCYQASGDFSVPSL